MHQEKLLKLLKNHKPYNSKEKEMLERFIDFVEREPNCFDNYCKEGHVTASAWVVDLEKQKTCLVHHVKIGKWFQPGGHSDGNPDTPQEALREAREELGMPDLELANEDIFDVDIQIISEDTKRDLGEHLHYDARFLIIADSNVSPEKSEESHDVRWVGIDEVIELNDDEALKRMILKTKKLETN